MSDDDTDILKREKPLLYGAIKLVINELKPIIYAVIAYVMAHNGEHKDVQWLGSHLSQKQQEIQQLQLEKLDNKEGR